MTFETKETGVNQDELVGRIMRYAGRSMSERNAPRNPNLTARQTIVLADYIAHLEQDAKGWERAADSFEQQLHMEMFGEPMET